MNYQKLGLGMVKKCTLIGNVKRINVDSRSYCVLNIGKHTHPKAVVICKAINARLPLPRNKQELDEFRKISGLFTHVDARNPNRTGNKAEWIDAEGIPLGDRPVYLKVTNIFRLLFTVSEQDIEVKFMISYNRLN